MQSRYIGSFQRCWACLHIMYPPCFSFFSASGFGGGGRCGFCPWRLGQTPQKIKEEIPHIKDSKSFWKRHLFYCSIILSSGSDLCINRKLSYISTDLFIKRLTRHFLKHKPSGKLFLPLDGHRSHCKSPLLLHATVENNVTIICLPSHCTHALQPLYKCPFGPVKSDFRNAAVA
jgi:hypothetical protein